MKKKNPKPKSKKRFAFYQQAGIYSNEILVCVGMNTNDAKRFMKRTKATRGVAVIERHADFVEKMLKQGATPQLQDEGSSIIFFGDWENDWKHIDTLTHELFHVVQYIAKEKCFSDEGENCAYLMEYLHREIRRKLNKE